MALAKNSLKLLRHLVRREVADRSMPMLVEESADERELILEFELVEPLGIEFVRRS